MAGSISSKVCLQCTCAVSESIHTHSVEGHKNWRGECKTMVCDDFSFFCKSAWNFECCFQLNRKTIPCIFSLVCSLFSRYYICKNLYFLSRQCVTAQMVISLKMQQNIDFSQKNVHFRKKNSKIAISFNLLCFLWCLPHHGMNRGIFRPNLLLF